MAIDGKKRPEERGKLHLRPHPREKSGEVRAKEGKEDKEEEEVFSEGSQDSESEGHSTENYEPSESGSDAETYYSENESDAEGSISSVNHPLKSPAKEMRKRPGRETKKDKKDVKKRRTEKTDDKIEIKHEEIRQEKILKKPGEDKEEKKGGGKKKETPIFNDKNVDFDLFNSSPSNVVSRKIKVSNNLMVTCRMIDQTEGKSSLTYDYAALTIQRKTANEKMFEFIIPLSLTPRIIEAMKIIVDENKKFFKPQSDSPPVFSKHN